MKTLKYLAILAALPIALSTASAQTAVQEIKLAQGWNAFYLEVTPDDPAPAAVFGDLPVTQLGSYEPAAYESTAQFREDGTPVEAQPVSYAVWVPENGAVSTLRAIVGGVVYLCYATNQATCRIEGVPVLPHARWRDTGHGAMMNLAGVSIAPGADSTLLDYFQEGPPSADLRPFLIGGRKTESPSFLPVSTSRKVRDGEAYALSAAKGGAWPGVLDVSTDRGGLLDLVPGASSGLLMVRNAGTSARTVRVGRLRSSRATDRWHGLLLDASSLPSGGSGWQPFEGPVERRLAPGERWTLRLAPDRGGVTDTNALYASLLSVEAVDDATRMRALVPVRLHPEAPGEGEAAFPAGLWVGTAELSQVGHGANAKPTQAGGMLPVILIIHVDEKGIATLLQRIAIAFEPADEKSSAPKPILYKELEDVPRGLPARRLSSIVLDTANRAVIAEAGPGGTIPPFGESRTTFRFVVDERSPENPFRHAWHPDHDGKTADYSAETPSGDVPSHFNGPVKPESFSIRNTVTLSWIGPDGTSTFGRDPDEGTRGLIEWNLGGLRGDGDIRVRGTFSLRRVVGCRLILD